MYQKVLVPLDGAPLAECVLPHLESMATTGQIKNVVLLRVVEPEPLPGVYQEPWETKVQDYKRTEAEHIKAAKLYLDEVSHRVKLGKATAKTEVLTGRAADSVAEYAKKNDADLLIVATHGRSGVSRWVWGSVADRILHSACVPVFMVRAPGCVPGF